MIGDDGTGDDTPDLPHDFDGLDDAHDDRGHTDQYDAGDAGDDGHIIHAVDGLDDDVLDGGLQPHEFDSDLNVGDDDGHEVDDAGSPLDGDFDDDPPTPQPLTPDSVSNDERDDGLLGGWLVPAPEVPAALLMPADIPDEYQAVDDPSTGSAMWAGQTFGLDQLEGYTDLTTLGVAEPSPTASG